MKTKDVVLKTIYLHKDGFFYCKPIEIIKINGSFAFKCECSTTKNMSIGIIKYFKASSLKVDS